MPKKINVALIGCGLMMRHAHLKRILSNFPNTHIPVVCEPSAEAYEAAAEMFVEAGRKTPPNEPDLEKLLAKYSAKLDAAFIVTPHAYHHDQTKACLEAGLDVLLEKPMVMNAEQAQSLIETRDRTGKLLVVSFQGSLSPQVRTAVKMLRAGELGELLNINAMVWQNWGENTAGTWRQVPKISGGGFLFDTGAHMLNTVADLAGEDFDEVAAWFDNRNRPVEILAVVIGRLKSGALVTLNGCGDAMPSCASDIRIFCKKGILRTGVWGERLEIQTDSEIPFEPVKVPASLGVWEQFLAVRAGKIENPSPPEIGLRMARLWDAIRKSAALNGQPVKCE